MTGKGFKAKGLNAKSLETGRGSLLIVLAASVMASVLLLPTSLPAQEAPDSLEALLAAPQLSADSPESAAEGGVSQADWDKAQGPDPASEAGAEPKPGSAVKPFLTDPTDPKAAALDTLADGDAGSTDAKGEVDPRASATPDAPFNGSYTYSVPIAVPGYRGLEPKLRLVYDSNRGLSAGRALAGWVGTGWSLEGFSSLVRVSARRGAPLYQDTDRWLLDGEELEPCKSGMGGASCKTGGTHTTRVESYRKIIYTKNTWTVTARDGTVYTYKSSGSQGVDTKPSPTNDLLLNHYHYVLTSAKDTHGNEVKYEYDCKTAAVCYPSKISYNQTTIILYREDKKNVSVMTVATGASLEKVGQRLDRIRVKTGSGEVRAYELSYDNGPTTASSRLTSVKGYGSDVKYDASNKIKGGSALPAIKFTYSSYAPRFDKKDVTNKVISFLRSTTRVIDIDGDSRADVVTLAPCIPESKCPIEVSLGSNNGLTAGVNYEGSRGEVPEGTVEQYWLSGDFDGSGLQQLLHLRIKREVIPLGDDKEEEKFYWNADILRFNSGTKKYSKEGWGPVSSGPFIPLLTKEEVDQGSVPIVADFNGDGKTDLLISGKFYLSKDKNKPVREVVTLPSCGSITTKLVAAKAGDYNGDGRADLACDHLVGVGGRGIGVLLSSPTSDGKIAFTAGEFTALPQEAEGYDNEGRTRRELLAGDINGDGRTDLVLLARTSGGGALVYALRSTGKGFVPDASGEMPYSWDDAAIGDFDGDGRSDVYLPLNSGGTLLLSQSSDFKKVTVGIPGGAQYSADLNGDGRADLFFVGKSTTTTWLSLDGTQDLMNSVQNVWGGTTKIEYKPSSRYTLAASASDRLPFIMQTVSKVTQNDGRGTASATEFSYSNGKWHPGERRFLGFASVIMSLPCTPGETTCPKVAYTFRQDLASAGKVVKKEVKVGTKVLRTVEETWDVEIKKVPYTAENIKTTTTDHLSGGNRRRSVSRAFDRYGNVTGLTDNGRDDLGGDERTVKRTFDIDAGKFMVNNPASEKVYGPGSVLLASSLFDYDDVGNLTRLRRWLDKDDSHVSRKFEYDGKGNRTKVTDELNRSTLTEYEETFNLFPVKVTNPKGQVTTATYDRTCGKPLSTVNLNGLTTTYDYDDFCRPLNTTSPMGAYTRYEYHSLGRIGTQGVTVFTPGPADGAAKPPELESRQYWDGLGRTYQTRTKDVSRDVLTLTAYNKRGLVERASRPFFEGDPVYWTTNTYDGLDRRIKQVLPDGRAIVTAYTASGDYGGFDAVKTTDPLLRTSTLHRDAQGRTIRQERLSDTAQAVSSTMTWDTLGRLTQLKDGGGHAALQLRQGRPQGPGHLGRRWPELYGRDLLRPRRARAETPLSRQGRGRHVRQALGLRPRGAPDLHQRDDQVDHL
ncbi:FG-GAP-like repeat-containing protein [Microvirga sp. 2YAF29]|uniref:FG-GAP-like repeat-containing protein n=1 Tax=Microvirga sp. 2YAF29 TaxID=3233031 RepID=UPI003F969E6D